MKRIAVMQPYLFPYLGYFQLIRSVDEFIFYDDVNFIKSGWINRNRIKINGEPAFITVPCGKVSSFKKINEILINWDENQKSKFLKKIEQNYCKTPYFYDVFEMISGIIKSDEKRISHFAGLSVCTVFNYLEIETKLSYSSERFDNCGLEKTERLVDICKKSNAETYINPVGGSILYKKEAFEKEGIKLFFLKSDDIVYSQSDDPFISNLSIIDALMYLSKEEIKLLLEKYQLL